MSFFESESEDSNDVDRWERIKAKELEKIDKNRKNWGSSRKAYYSSDTQYFELDEHKEDTIRLEESEVKRIQQEQAAMLQQMDFGLDDILGSAPKKSKKSKAADAKKKTAITVKKSNEDKVKELLALSPELLTFTKEYTSKSTFLTQRVKPLIASIQSDKLSRSLPPDTSTTPIISFIKLYEQLLYACCTCILFYLHLHSQGIETSGHPVIERINKFLTILEQQQDSFESIEGYIYTLTASSKKRSRSNSSLALTHQDDMDGDDDDDDSDGPIQYRGDGKSTPVDYADYYRSVSQSRKQSRIEREASHKRDFQVVQLKTVDEDYRRRANAKILKNRGLSRQKSKKQIKNASNARLHLRTKHEKALQKRKSAVKEYKGKIGDSYTGESQGIKRGLIRSIKL